MEVDLVYPKEFCELHNNYHLAAEKKKSKKRCYLIIN